MVSLLKKIYSFLKETISFLVLVKGFLPVPVIIAIFVTIKKFISYLSQNYSIEIPIYVWAILYCLFIYLLIFIIYHYILKIHEHLKRLQDPKDIQYAIEEWFSNRYAQIGKQYYFKDIDRNLNIKRGSSKKYLPIIALQKKYSVKCGNDTFLLTALTADNVKATLGKYWEGVDNSKKELVIDCRQFASQIGWPVEAAKQLLFALKTEKLEIQSISRYKVLLKIKT